jgi:hypothetical protein
VLRRLVQVVELRRDIREEERVSVRPLRLRARAPQQIGAPGDVPAVEPVARVQAIVHLEPGVVLAVKLELEARPRQL